MNDLSTLAERLGAGVTSNYIMFRPAQLEAFAAEVRAAALAQGAEPARDWDAESGCEWFATPPAATQVSALSEDDRETAITACWCADEHYESERFAELARRLAALRTPAAAQKGQP